MGYGGTYMHKAYVTSWLVHAPGIKDYLLENKADLLDNVKTFMVAGHSLGAALAMISSIDMSCDDRFDPYEEKIKTVRYGSVSWVLSNTTLWNKNFVKNGKAISFLTTFSHPYERYDVSSTNVGSIPLGDTKTDLAAIQSDIWPGFKTQADLDEFIEAHPFAYYNDTELR